MSYFVKLLLITLSTCSGIGASGYIASDEGLVECNIHGIFSRVPFSNATILGVASDFQPKQGTTPLGPVIHVTPRKLEELAFSVDKVRFPLAHDYPPHDFSWLLASSALSLRQAGWFLYHLEYRFQDQLKRVIRRRAHVLNTILRLIDRVKEHADEPHVLRLLLRVGVAEEDFAQLIQDAVIRMLNEQGQVEREMFQVILYEAEWLFSFLPSLSHQLGSVMKFPSQLLDSSVVPTLADANNHTSLMLSRGSALALVAQAFVDHSYKPFHALECIEALVDVGKLVHAVQELDK